MSGRIVKEVLEHAPESLAPVEFKVLVSLAEAARPGDRSTRGSSAAVSVIAYRARASEGAVRNALSALTRRGLIKATGGRAHRGTAQNYCLTELYDYHRGT